MMADASDVAQSPMMSEVRSMIHLPIKNRWGQVMGWRAAYWEELGTVREVQREALEQLQGDSGG